MTSGATSKQTSEKNIYIYNYFFVNQYKWGNPQKFNISSIKKNVNEKSLGMNRDEIFCLFLIVQVQNGQIHFILYVFFDIHKY